MKTLQKIFDALNIPPVVVCHKGRLWQEACHTCPPSIEALQGNNIRQAMDWCRLDCMHEEQLLAVAKTINTDNNFRQLFHYLEMVLLSSPKNAEITWPDFSSPLPKDQGVPNLLLGLAMIPHIKSIHNKLTIPEAISRDTCSQVACFCANHQVGNQGEIGILDEQLHWLRHYVDGKLFRLGRFEYRVADVNIPVKIFEHRQTKKIVCLSEDNIDFTKEGHAKTQDSVTLNSDWAASLKQSHTSITGNPICPAGQASQKIRELPLDQWQLILEKKTQVLDMHIPSGGAMDLDSCAESFAQAFDFFEKYFPNTYFPAITCTSWILNTQWQQYLPNSNLARFMESLYLLPVNSPKNAGLFFIFCRNDEENIAAYPQDTSLQRAMLKILSEGKSLRNGGMFFLKNHSLFGGQYTVPRIGAVGARILFFPHSL